MLLTIKELNQKTNNRKYVETAKYLETKLHTSKNTHKMKKSKGKSENTSRQIKMEMHHFKNLWDAAKADLRGNFIAVKVYLKNQEGSQTS